jgi:hypothetical protein
MRDARCTISVEHPPLYRLRCALCAVKFQPTPTALPPVLCVVRCEIAAHTHRLAACSRLVVRRDPLKTTTSYRQKFCVLRVACWNSSGHLPLYRLRSAFWISSPHLPLYRLRGAWGVVEFQPTPTALPPHLPALRAPRSAIPGQQIPICRKNRLYSDGRLHVPIAVLSAMALPYNGLSHCFEW